MRSSATSAWPSPGPGSDLYPGVGWFQSFKTPLAIMAAIPFSLVGSCRPRASGSLLYATSMIGFIAGAGIVVRNSIILVDFVELRLKQGVDLAEAVIDAGAVRFRPMMLTAAAVIVAPRSSSSTHLPGPGHLAHGRRGRFALAVADDRADSLLSE